MQNHNEIFSKRLRQLQISQGSSIQEFAAIENAQDSFIEKSWIQAEPNQVFQANLKSLRYQYQLSTSELALKLGYKYGSTISEFENGKSTPSFNSLISLVAFFGVTIDWIVGQSKIKYSEESIVNAENRLYGQFDKPTKSLLKREYPQYYSLLSRQSHYDFEMRSTILVGFQLLSSKDLWWGTQHFYDIVQGKYKKFLHKKEKRIIKLISLLKIYPLQVI